MEVALATIQFNHNTNSARDSALNTRTNATQTSSLPEWRKTVLGETFNSAAAYSIADTAGRTIRIQASFVRVNPTLQSAEIRALPASTAPYPWWWPQFLLGQYQSTPVWYYPYSLYSLYVQYLQFLVESSNAPTNRVLGEVGPKRVDFRADGTTGVVTFDLDGPRLGATGVGLHRMRWVWQYRRAPGDIWQPFEDSEHTIYTLLNTPTDPWQQAPFTAANTQIPWTEVMDYACQWAAGARDAEDAAAQITRNVYDLGNSLLEYDCVGGGNSRYATPIGSAFDCTAFLERLRGAHGNGRYVNCTDCATIVSTFANIVGCDLSQSRMGTIVGPIILFAVNPVQAIGSRRFSLPCGWPGFTYHEVAWTRQCTQGDDVFDACVQVNGSANPSRPPQIPLLPAGLRFGATGDGQYRDRLAAPGSEGICEPRPATRVRRFVF